MIYRPESYYTDLRLVRYRAVLERIAQQAGKEGVEDGQPVLWDGEWAAHQANEALKKLEK